MSNYLAITRAVEQLFVIESDTGHPLLELLDVQNSGEHIQVQTALNGVLARAEVESSYRPARKLWVRTRNGYYMPNPQLRLRVLDENGQEQWQPVYDTLRLGLVEQGLGRYRREMGVLSHVFREIKNPLPFSKV